MTPSYELRFRLHLSKQGLLKDKDFRIELEKAYFIRNKLSDYVVTQG